MQPRDPDGREVQLPGVAAFSLDSLATAPRTFDAARQTFLLQLHDALRQLTDAAAIQATVTQTARQYFTADRC